MQRAWAVTVALMVLTLTGCGSPAAQKRAVTVSPPTPIRPQHDVDESAVSYGGTQPDGPNHCDGSQRNNRAYSHSAAIVRCGTVNGYTVDADAATNDSHSIPTSNRCGTYGY